MTNKERLDANNEKIKEIQETLKNKILKANGQGEYFVKVIDYDGTILKEAWLDEGETFTLPTPPSHDGLVFQEWSCSQEIVDNTITITDNNIMAGAVYTTASGLSEFDIEITKAMEADIATNGFVVTLNMDGTKDWGDGTSDDLTTHTYTNYGEYTIKCNGTTMTTSSSSGLFGQKGTSGYQNYYLKHVRFVNISTITNYALAYTNSLEYVIMSNLVTTINSNAFYASAIRSVILPSNSALMQNKTKTFDSCKELVSVVLPLNNKISYIDGSFRECVSLVNIAIPKNVKVMSGSFYHCESLEHIIIPNSVTSFGNSVMSYCYSLKEIYMPDSIKTTRTLNSSTFSDSYSLQKVRISNSLQYLYYHFFKNCINLREIEIPSSIIEISQNAFNGCTNLLKYDFTTYTFVPTLQHVDAFIGISPLAKIIVPDNLYDEWIVATNWATYSNYIHKVSEVRE